MNTALAAAFEIERQDGVLGNLIGLTVRIGTHVEGQFSRGGTDLLNGGMVIDELGDPFVQDEVAVTRVGLGRNDSIDQPHA